MDRQPSDEEFCTSLILYILGVTILASAGIYIHATFSGEYSMLLLLLFHVLIIGLCVTVNVMLVHGRFQIISTSKLSAIVFHFIYLAVTAYIIVTISLLYMVARESRAWSIIFLTLTWTVLATLTLVLVMLARKNTNVYSASLGVISAGVVFISAFLYVPSLYGWDLRPLGWYAILVTSVPLLMFIGVILKCIRIFSTEKCWQFILTGSLFIVLVIYIVLQMAVAPQHEIRSALKYVFDSGENEMRLAELTNFEWDFVEIYNPYTPLQYISLPTQKKIDVITLYKFGISEGFYLLVFLNDGEVVYYEDMPSRIAHFIYPVSVNPIKGTYEDTWISIDYHIDNELSPSVSFFDGL